MNAAQICRLYDHLKGARGNWESHWEDLAKYTQPKKEYIHTRKDLSPGEQRGQNIYDATAIHAAELLSSALHSMLTNPALKWFELSTGIMELDKDDDVRAYLQKTEDIIFETLSNSNFGTEVHEYYLDLVTLGTGFMFIEEDDRDDVLFKADSIYNQVIDEDHNGIVNTLIRRLRWSAKQIFEKWGEKAFKSNDNLKKEYETQQNKKHDVLHAIVPVTELVLKEHPKLKRFKFASIYIMRNTKTIIDVKGFKTFPACASRWTKMVGEIYGRSPASKSLPDIKMLDKVALSVIKATEKKIDPPMMVPDDGMYHTPNIQPGGINYYRPGSKDRIEVMPSGADPVLGMQYIERLEMKVEKAFFIDQLQLREGPQMTATEVVQRTEENLRLLGPILGRQNFEYLTVLIDRVFSILEKKDKLPNPPEILRESGEVRVQYSSMIAKAQKMVQVENMNRAVAAIAPLMEIDPSVADNFETDEMFDFVFKTFGLPQQLKRNTKEVAAKREEAAAQQEEANRLAREESESATMEKSGNLTLKAQEQGMM